MIEDLAGFSFLLGNLCISTGKVFLVFYSIWEKKKQASAVLTVMEEEKHTEGNSRIC